MRSIANFDMYNHSLCSTKGASDIRVGTSNGRAIDCFEVWTFLHNILLLYYASWTPNERTSGRRLSDLHTITRPESFCPRSSARPRDRAVCLDMLMTCLCLRSVTIHVSPRVNCRPRESFCYEYIPGPI